VSDAGMLICTLGYFETFLPTAAIQTHGWHITLTGLCRGEQSYDFFQIRRDNMNDIKPESYALQIKPDLPNFSFTGEVTIHLTTSEPASELTLNAKELAVWSCRVLIDGQFEECPFSLDSSREILSVNLPRKVAGSISVQISYEGKINDQMAGFYRSRYVENEEDKYIAVTQFQESDARRMIPCMDNPLHKATFDIEMIVDEKLEAISNEVIIEKKKIGGGKKLIKFRKTPRMSTYLLFMGIGDFDYLRNIDEPRVSVVTLPNQTQYGELGVTFGQKALDYCEKYFQIPYPLPKLDLIAVPDFAFGAMENWGAITFRENLLLFYPGTTSKAGEHRICEVIAHEIVHQWFGNLVTPSDWKYLWLNESFATYFAYRVVDHYYPHWDTWGQFLTGQTDSAFSRDQLRDTQPIEIPGGGQVMINVSTAPIIYSKGGSILRQVEGYIGEEAFQTGLNYYLSHYAYGNAASEDLWKAFETVSEKPVVGMMKNWVEQPGYPFVEVERKDNALILTQHRFTCLPGSFDQTWLIPISIVLFDKEGNSRRVEMLMDGKTAGMDLDDHVAAYKINDGQTGFYRVKYLNDENLNILGDLINKKKLSSQDRWGIQNDLFAMVKSGNLDIIEYVKFLAHFVHEDAFLPLTSIASNLYQAFMILKGSKREKIKKFGADFFAHAISQIGFDPSPEEPVTTSILRDQVLWHGFVYGWGEADAFGRDRFLKLLKGESIHPDIMKAVLQIGAQTHEHEALEWMKKRLKTSESEHERMNILAGLSCFSEPELIHKALDFVLDEVPSRNKFMPIVAMGGNHYAEPFLWDWFLKNLSKLEKMHPLHFERVITGVAPMAGIEKAPEVKGFLKDYMVKSPRTKDAVEMALEKLEINVRMRNS
jgi:aminopeptidase N